MAQVTIYLDKKTDEMMRSHVKTKKVSQSQWIANIIREKLQSEWPEEVVALVGAWKDFPTLEEIRATEVPDMPRESI